MNSNLVVNMVWMQVLWFSAVLGAANNLLWIAPFVLLGFAAWVLTQQQGLVDLKIMLVAVLIGLILDTTWISLGWLEFAQGWPFQNKAPVWILLLWAGFALTLNYSLAWLQTRLALAAVLGGIFSVSCYLAAVQMGAVIITTESSIWMVGLGLSWAVTMPLLLWLARALKQLEKNDG